MAASPDAIQGPIIVVAHITAAPGKGDEVENLFKAIQASAHSDAEPGALTLRVSRFGEWFITFEEYLDLAALGAHRETAAFVAFFQAGEPDGGLIVKREVAFYKEI
ncbi:hypothetical protein DL93DRAFT_2168576 [Clavulina sp. PMI_390]|nr:hypothetical protein DL93DRAFT_2168576 [Clavulina sp. PMI_390]